MMRLKKKKNVSPEAVEHFSAYQKAAVEWESNQYRKDRAISWMLWAYSCLTTIAVVVLGLAIAALTPLKRTQPYLIRVDSSTGIVQVLAKTDLQHAQFTQTEQEALDKFFLSQYVLSREGYNYALVDAHYNKVAVMSTPAVSKEYLDAVIVSNPSSPIHVLGKNKIRIVKIQSISFPRTNGDQVAYVRYIGYVNNTAHGEKSEPKHYLATLNYKYVNSALSNEVRQLNPLGFVVTAYQVTREAQ